MTSHPAPAVPSDDLLRFGDFELDARELSLRQRGAPVPLTRKTFDTLAYLARHPGRLVSRQELLDAVWPDAFVEEGNLNWVMSTLRKALGPGPSDGEWIQTVRGAGYRFAAPVEVAARAGSPPLSGSPGRVARPRWLVLAGTGIACLFGLGLLLGSRFAGMAEGGAKRSFAVLAPRNLAPSAGGETDWLGLAIAEMVRADLDAGGALRAANLEEVERVRREATGAGEAEVRAALRQRLGVDVVVGGSFLTLGGEPGGPARAQVRIDLVALDPASEEPLAAASRSGEIATLLEWMPLLSAELRQGLGLSAPAADGRGAPLRATPADPDAARRYAEGLDLLRRGEAGAALAPLREAVLAAPAFAPARLGLALAYERLGDRRNAENELLAAIEHSAGLSARDRALVEARYRRVTYRPVDAATILAHLWQEDRGDLDVALELALAQHASYDIPSAQETLRRARRLATTDAERARVAILDCSAVGPLNRPASADLVAARDAVSWAERAGSQRLLAEALGCLASAARTTNDHALFDQTLLRLRTATANARDERLAADLFEVEGWAALWKAVDLDAAEGRFRSAAAKYAALGSIAGRAQALGHLGDVADRRGELGAAEDLYGEMRALCERAQDLACRARAERKLATILTRRPDLDRAETFALASREAARRAGDLVEESAVLEVLGVVAEKRGDSLEAEAHYRAKLALDLRLGLEGQAVYDRIHIATLYDFDGRHLEAIPIYREVIASAERLRLQNDEVEARGRLGSALWDAGRREEALAETRRAFERAQTLEDYPTRFIVELTYASLLDESGRLAEARALAEAGLERDRVRGFSGYVLQWRHVLGEIEIDEGEVARGLQHLRELEAEARTVGELGIAEGVARSIAAVTG